MVTDALFYSEKRLFNKTALLLTKPCAILPVMMATGGMLSMPFSPMLFRYDFILYGLVYIVYSSGIYLSWRQHRSPIPFIILGIHITDLIFYVFSGSPDWVSYLAILSIMATSLSNQYFRSGSIECHKCNNYTGGAHHQ